MLWHGSCSISRQINQQKEVIMENTLELIAEFLNVPLDTLKKSPLNLLLEMQEAVKDEDYFRIHELGYKIK